MGCRGKTVAAHISVRFKSSINKVKFEIVYTYRVTFLDTCFTELIDYSVLDKHALEEVERLVIREINSSHKIKQPLTLNDEFIVFAANRSGFFTRISAKRLILRCYFGFINSKRRKLLKLFCGNSDQLVKPLSRGGPAPHSVFGSFSPLLLQGLRNRFCWQPLSEDALKVRGNTF